MENYKEIERLLLAKRTVYQTEIDKIDSILLSLGGKSKPGPKPGKRAGKMSAAGRAAIAKAQRERWAKLKSKTGLKPGKKKYKMSRAGRLAIARAKKAWWAQKKAAQKK
jgi:hypothetical protein